MNKIAAAFRNKKALVAFITGGDPDIETTERLIHAMVEAGVDLVELGIPFSDPVAEGPVIEAASARALESGTTVDQLFHMVTRVRETIQIPIVFLSYANPIFAYGTERFMTRAAESGIDGIIVPDIPFEEKGEFAEACAKYGIAQISLIAPTSEDRIEKIAREAEGFLYCVSSLGTTGARDQIDMDMAAMVQQAKGVTDIPCAIGFGITTPELAKRMAHLSDGVIVGSAIVRLIGKFGRNSVEPVRQFVKSIKAALS